MTTGDKDLDVLIMQIGDQQESDLRARLPLLAATLDLRYFTEADGDGQTWWLRDLSALMPAEPFGSEQAANEARDALIVHQLTAASRQLDQDRSTDR